MWSKMWEIAKSLVLKAIFEAFLNLGKKAYNGRRKNVEFEEIKERIQNGDLRFGDKITVVGTYSEFVPFINMSQIVLNTTEKESYLPPLPTFGTSKIEPMQDEHVGALLNENSRGIYAGSESIPIFFSQKYSKNSIKTLNSITGDIIELEGVISPLPTVWKDIVIASDFFSVDRGDGFAHPFCLKVSDVDQYGIHLDEFRGDLWSLAHFKGAPMDLARPDTLSFLEVEAPPQLVTENIFPGAFQFVFPEVNIINSEELRELKTELDKYVSQFPNHYLNTIRLLGHSNFKALKKKKQTDFVYDASSFHFKSEPISSSNITKKEIQRIDKNHEIVFEDFSENLIRKEIELLESKIIEEAKKYPKFMINSLLPVRVGKLVYEDTVREKNEENQKNREHSMENIQLNLDMDCAVRNMLGHYIREYGKDVERFSEIEFQEFFDSGSFREFGDFLILFMLLSEVRKGNLKLVMGKEGRLAFTKL